ncbi:MAG: NifU family protein [Alphaproteobacteria bacterium]|nr:NifU family protein [Alphaproteobacteria bacterium]
MITTGNLIVSVYTEQTPNPQTMKFVANKLLYPSKSIDIMDNSLEHLSPLAKELFGFPFIKSVFIASNFITLTKSDANQTWESIIPSLKSFIKNYIEQEGLIVDEEAIETYKKEQVKATTIGDDSDVITRIKELLENYVKPAVEMDGGAIEFKSYKDGVVNLAMQGSCSGCPSSTVTLKAGIEGMMKRMIPEVTEVVAEGE